MFRCPRRANGNGNRKARLAARRRVFLLNRQDIDRDFSTPRPPKPKDRGQAEIRERLARLEGLLEGLREAITGRPVTQ